MIRGAFILAVGFSLGYAKALSENTAVAEMAQAAKEYFENLDADKAPKESSVDSSVEEIEIDDAANDHSTEGESA